MAKPNYSNDEINDHLEQMQKVFRLGKYRQCTNTYRTVTGEVCFYGAVANEMDPLAWKQYGQKHFEHPAFEMIDRGDGVRHQLADFWLGIEGSDIPFALENDYGMTFEMFADLLEQFKRRPTP